jgi:uncharacterized protein YjbI with pentapeptide repeats
MEPDLLWRERAACGHYRQLHSSRRLDRSRSVPEGRGCDFVGVVHRQTQQEAVIQGNHRERVKINRELPNRRTGVRGCHGVSQRPRIAQQSARLVHRLARTTIADKQRNKSTRLGITLHSHDVGNRPDALVNIAAKGLTAEPSCREPQDGERNHLVPWFPSRREQLDARLVQHPRCEYACFIIHVREVASGQLPRTRRSGRHGLRRGPASTQSEGMLMAACAGDIRNTQSEPDMTMNNAQMVEAKLERARLSGCLLMHADLRDSDLTRAILVRANLAKADLRGCNMRGADLTGTNLGGASMEGVVLTGALICSTNFEGANLVGALVDKANLSNSSIRRSAGIRDLGDLNASLAQILSGHAVWTQSGGSTGQRADLGGVDLSGANLRNVDLGAAIMRGAILRWADLSGALLAMADLSLVDAREANLANADLRGAKLERATLSHATLAEIRAQPLIIAGGHRCRTDWTSARLDHTCLLQADLSMGLLAQANLSHADIRGANMSGASLCGANLTGLDLRTVTLDGADLTEAIGMKLSLLAITSGSGVALGGTPFGP